MKIKKAFDICKRDNNIATYSITKGELWLTNGVAAWSLNDVPDLSEDYICQLYDINDKKREKIHPFSSGLINISLQFRLVNGFF